MEYANYSGLPLALATIFHENIQERELFDSLPEETQQKLLLESIRTPEDFHNCIIGWRKKSDKEEPLWRNYRWDLEWHSRKTPAQWNIFQNRPRKSRRKFWHTRIQFNPAMKCMPMCRALAIFKPTAGAPRGKMATLSRRHGEHRIGNARQPSLDCPPRSLYPIE